MRLRSVLVVAVVLLFAANASATLINVAEGKNVTLHGHFGELRLGSGWDPADPPAAASTLVDGVFRPLPPPSGINLWTAGTVWWDEQVSQSADNWIEIDLLGTYTLLGFIVQADDNDSYRLEYWNGGGWTTAWDIPAVGGWGLQTRPNTGDNSEIYMLGSSITTDRLRFTATGGDDYYSVAEIQAYAVPEPGTAGLLILGCTALAARFRRRGRE